MRNRKISLRLLTLIGSALMCLPVLSQQTIVSIHNMEPEKLFQEGFRLNSEQEIEIVAVAAHQRDRYKLASAAWVMDIANREIVWELTDANSSWKSKYLREYKDRVSLPAGAYQLFFTNYVRDYYKDEKSWSIVRFFLDKDDRDYEDLIKDFSIEVNGNGTALKENEVRRLSEEARQKAAVSLLARNEEEFLQQGFKVSKPTEFNIYAVGEGGNDGMYDYGWIMNTADRERVWVMKYRDSDDAGGSYKNRVVRDEITLPKGEYVAYYVTDDSHNPRDWNSLPPYDPDFWGLTLYVNDPDQRGNVSLFDYQDVPSKNVIVDLTRMRDDEHASKSFSLSQDMNVRIYALGEGDHGEMYDYGWLVNGDTRERVWEMKYRDTEHAGGNSKNRLIDEVISLPKGNYTAYYVTDGSHSYRDWNASPPFDQQNWGLTILAADDGFKPSFVGNFQPNAAKNVIAHITEVRDWETRKVQFEIEKDGEVRIYALGEGSDGEMFDYGWIEDSSNGKVVWEMTYRRTEHAGGARKNRLFNDLVYLRKGRYVLYFESDDSHSYGDWNSSPPRDPENWGITIFKVDK